MFFTVPETLFPRIYSVRFTWFLITFMAWGLSFPGYSRISTGMPIFPRSCSMAPHMTSFTVSFCPHRRMASSELMTEVVMVWVTVWGLLKSMAYISIWRMDSFSSSVNGTVSIILSNCGKIPV